MSDVILLAKSVDTFLPISAPKAVNNPLSLKPIALSKAPLTAKPPIIPACSIPSLTTFFNTGFDILPDTTGAPNVLLWIIPYGLLSCFLYFFCNAKETAPPNE